MISVLENKKCCGCTACAEICAVGAIKMTADGEGFLYPTVDKSLCTRCGRCEKVCSALNKPDFNTNPDCYAVQLNDGEALSKSQSGGAFFAVADYIFSLGGVVYGVKSEGITKAVYARAENKSEAEVFHGSKYIQAEVNGVYKQVKKDLEDGKTVLFSGTACHSAGLYKYLGHDYQNLYTLDIVCHGTPSPLVFEKYIEGVEKKNGKIADYRFRYKGEELPWGRKSREKITFEDGHSVLTDKFLKTFYSTWIIRPYCNTCPYAKTDRVSDFTVGDFWGIEKEQNTPFDIKKGASEMLFNSPKAKALEEEILSRTVYEKREIGDLTAHQPNLLRPTKRSNKRKYLFPIFRTFGFNTAYFCDRVIWKLSAILGKLK